MTVPGGWTHAILLSYKDCYSFRMEIRSEDLIIHDIACGPEPSDPCVRLIAAANGKLYELCLAQTECAVRIVGFKPSPNHHPREIYVRQFSPDEIIKLHTERSAQVKRSNRPNGLILPF